MGTGMPLGSVSMRRTLLYVCCGRQYSLLPDDATLSASRILFNIDQCLANP